MANRMNRGLFTSAAGHWGTPRAVFEHLDAEFGFDLDPCPGELPLKAGLRQLEDGLRDEWFPFRCAFVNPPYGRSITLWLGAAINQMYEAIAIRNQMKANAHDWSATHVRELHTGRWIKAPEPKVVLLVPARTDTAWWHELMGLATEVRFLRGRLAFEGVETKPEKDRQKQRSRAPFPSAVVVLDPPSGGYLIQRKHREPLYDPDYVR